jgi:hypothetical protein
MSICFLILPASFPLDQPALEGFVLSFEVEYAKLLSEMLGFWPRWKPVRLLSSASKRY